MAITLLTCKIRCIVYPLEPIAVFMRIIISLISIIMIFFMFFPKDECIFLNQSFFNWIIPIYPGFHIVFTLIAFFSICYVNNYYVD